MKINFESLSEGLSPESQKILERVLLNGPSSVRFFSYGSNMNEKKFERDMNTNGKGLKLINARKRILLNYKRALSNESKRGLAFTIFPCKGEEVEGICHDVPIDNLRKFLKKEGLTRNPPRYKLVDVRIVEENHPVLTLIGLCNASTKSLTDNQRWKTLQYLCASIVGAREFSVTHNDMLEIKKQIEDELPSHTNFLSVEKMYDWGLQRQLTWAVIVLTCFTGLIELLSIIAWNPADVLLYFCFLLIYCAFVSGLLYSIYHIKVTFENMTCYGKELKKRIINQHELETSPHLTWITKSDGHVRGWVFWVVIIILFVIWSLIFVDKLLPIFDYYYVLNG